MPTLYRRKISAGFGNPAPGDPDTEPRPKPLKRPHQARARFTVHAIYDAFVRIWHAQGWRGVTTRAVALEAGISIGTLYDYFPNKEALLSGYVRHCMDALLGAIDMQVIQPAGLAWKERLRRLVQLTAAFHVPDLPYFDAEMLKLESLVAESKHHRRVFDELSGKWVTAVDACTDLHFRPDAVGVRSLFATVWGGKRYLLLLDADPSFASRWTDDIERMCIARFEDEW
jgi:AcrR family transcriptional regulator